MELLRFCVVCTQQIELKRTLRGACTCSRECARTHGNGIRAYKHSVRCPKCGRRSKASRAANLEIMDSADSAQAGVLMSETVELGPDCILQALSSPSSRREHG